MHSNEFDTEVPSAEELGYTTMHTSNARSSTSSSRRAKRRQSASNAIFHMLKQEMVSSMMRDDGDDEEEENDGKDPVSEGTSPESEEDYYCDPDDEDAVNSIMTGVSEQLSEFAEALFSSVDTKQAPQQASSSPDVKNMIKAGMTNFSSKDNNNNNNNSHGKMQRKASVSSTIQESSMSGYDWMHDTTYNSEEALYQKSGSSLGLHQLSPPQPNRKSSMGSSSKIQDLLLQFTEIALSSDDEEEKEDEDYDDDACSFISDITGFASHGAVAMGQQNSKKHSTISVSSRSSGQQVMILNIPKTISGGVVDNIKPSSKTIVRFHRVHIRYYKQVMCDHPSSSGGPSIGLGWKYRPTTNKDRTVDEYENERKPQRKKLAIELLMSRREREDIVKRWGYPQKEIAETIRVVNKIRMQRRQTVNNRSVQKMEEAAEKLGRKFKKMIFLSKKK